MGCDQRLTLPIQRAIRVLQSFWSPLATLRWEGDCEIHHAFFPWKKLSAQSWPIYTCSVRFRMSIYVCVSIREMFFDKVPNVTELESFGHRDMIMSSPYSLLVRGDPDTFSRPLTQSTGKSPACMSLFSLLFSFMFHGHRSPPYHLIENGVHIDILVIFLARLNFRQKSTTWNDINTKFLTSNNSRMQKWRNLTYFSYIVIHPPTHWAQKIRRASE